MDKPVLIIELPELSDEAVSEIHNFLQEFRDGFESHYIGQLRRYYQGPSDKELMDILF